MYIPIYIYIYIYIYLHIYIYLYIYIPRGRPHKTKRCRDVTYPESYITKYTTFTKDITV